MKKIYALKDPSVSQRETANNAISRRAAGECMVLLENDGTLPLRSAGKIALYGSGARQTVRGGTGSGAVNVRSAVNIEEGLERAGFSVTTKDWLDRQDAAYSKARICYRTWFREYARQHSLSEQTVTFMYPFLEIAPVEVTEDDIAASGTDTAVFVISRNSGEGADRHFRRGDYLLYKEEKDCLGRIARAYKRTVVVLNIGGVMDLTELKATDGVNAVLLMGQLGSAGGDALADVLLGITDPSGRLTDTWARRYEDYPSSAGFSHNDGDVDDEYYTEGIYVGYRYFDTFRVEPLYPFGYGRSYTEFSLSDTRVQVKGGQVKVRTRVRNTGEAYAGRQVIQVYISAPDGKLKKPHQELVGFAKTGLLAPGECETVEIAFDARDMASYCEECAAWVLEAGEYAVRVGTSSKDTEVAAVLTLDRTVKTEILKNLFAGGDSVREIAAPPQVRETVDPSVPRTALREIPTRQAVYQGERRPFAASAAEMLTARDVKSGACTVEELVSQLTVEEMASLCVGTFRSAGSVVGNASRVIPGAAGDTSAVCMETRGIQSMIMADGPAGLRLQPVFKTTKDGELLPDGHINGEVFTPFDPGHTEENSDTYYQYCTAIPIGWCLAQSWDIPLLEELGGVIGGEMELFGVDLWLAPAMNIHRNPLCGRNFEYYSEDPLVSGRAAAAVTRGVQRHPGRGTTVKHFAANNQEDNRYLTNSHIRERAIREIYLRGFEIAIKESQPMAIMTSYNLINGVHAANSYDLIQSAARDEWGFRGLVMTDWLASQDDRDLTGGRVGLYGVSASAGCVFAGNDIQMPGCQKNADDIIEAVKTGRELDGFRTSLADLQFCAANIIRVAVRMSKSR